MMNILLRNTIRTSLLIALFLMPIMETPLLAGQETKRVFVLNSFNPGYTWTDNMLRGIDDTFASSGITVETYVRFMDMKRVTPTAEYFTKFKEMIGESYKGVSFDAILACDNDAFEFTKKYRDELFPGVPVVFSSINDFDRQMLEGRKDITGTSENTDYAGTIKVALKLLPATKNIVIVTDNTTTGKAHRSAVEKLRPAFPQSIGFAYLSLSDMTMDELAGKLSKLEKGSVVLLLQHFMDRDGKSYTVQNSTPLLTKSSSVPVFVLTDIRMGLGALGGDVVSGYHHGEAAAQMVVRILKGTDVKSIPVLLDSPNRYMFDYSVMQRFRIAESDLPPGSILINKPVSLLDEYRPYLYAVLAALAILSAFVAYLLLEIRKRKAIEASLQVASDKLQEQYEELQVNEESLRDQNDELLSTEEMLRVQISEYEISQKLLKDSEEALKRQNGLFSTLLKILPIGVFMVEAPSGKPLLANEAAFNLLGQGILPDASRHNLSQVYRACKIGSHDPYPPEEMPILLGMSGVSSHVEDMEVERPDGSKNILEIFGSPVTDDQGHTWASLVSFIDITERKRAEEVLRKSEEKHRTILNSAMDGFWLVSERGQLLDVNEAYCRMSGYSVQELLTMSIADLEVNETAADAVAHNIKIMKQGEDRFETQHRRKDGSILDVEVSATYISVDGGLLVGFLRDITDRTRTEKEKTKLESQLQQAQKMESVGRLAGGVAHDFNNMLTVILGHAQLGLMNLDPTHPVVADLKEISRTAERSADLTRQLLAFARKQTVTPRVIDLNEAVSAMLKMLQRLIGEDIYLTWRAVPGLWQVTIDPSQIDQILANLCVNARDAIENTGRISIETENRIIDEEYCATNPDATPGEYVRLTVSDDGTGMDKETLTHIFEPFYTTKELGKGTGLGLATVYGAVKQNSGFISVYSEPGQGTSFSIFLPRSEGSKCSQAQAKGAAAVVQRGQETILLVEDELAILNIAAIMLEKQGYFVLKAGTPGEAIRLAREHSGDIHLLMTDVIMPEMNGRDLARNLLSMYPHMKRLFMSGYTAEVITHQGILDEGVHFIQKPFSLPDMAAMVREVLDGR